MVSQFRSFLLLVSVGSSAGFLAGSSIIQTLKFSAPHPSSQLILERDARISLSGKHSHRAAQRSSITPLRMEASGADSKPEIPRGRGSEKVVFRRRRGVIADALRLGAACGCASCFTSSEEAWALAQLVAPPSEALKDFEEPRNDFLDAAFACGMATGMADYEEAAASRKAAIFKNLFSSLPKKDAVIAEVGIGSFPNAPFFSVKEAPRGMDIIGIDPNDKMARYAAENARKAKIVGKRPVDPMAGATASQNSLRIVHGISEALPLADASCDAVICSLTLCSVKSPEKSVAEIKRVLKPGGKFLFWEHVLSETDPGLARQQIALTPNQVKRADGCHLDRRTGETIKSAGFSKLDLQYFELENFGFLNPTVAGIATA